MNEDVAYEETPELIEAQKRAAINQRLNLTNPLQPGKKRV